MNVTAHDGFDPQAVLSHHHVSLPFRLMLGLACALLFAAGYADAANAPALQVDGVQGLVQVQRLGRRMPLHLGNRVIERDVVKLGKDAQLSLSMANRVVFQLAGAGEISVEQLPGSQALAANTTAEPIPAPVIVSLERGDLHLLWHPATADTTTAGPDQLLYVYFAGRRVALMPGEYFFGQFHENQAQKTSSKTDETQICVAAGQAETMTIAAGKSRVIPAHSCESQQGRRVQVVARDAATWPRLRQQFVFPEQVADGASDGLASLRLDARLALSPPKLPSAPVQAPAAASASALGDRPDEVWAINVASYGAADDARQQQQHLQSSGYQAVVVPAKVDGRTWYRVQVGDFTTPAAAHATAVALQTHLGFNQLWVMHRP